MALLPRGGGGFLGLAEDREVADAGADGKLAAALALGCDLHAAKIEVRGGLDEVVAESVLDADVVGDFRSVVVRCRQLPPPLAGCRWR